MSRAATATPPPAYFPQRTSTPTMRHCSGSAPTVSAAHFAQAQSHRVPKPIAASAGRRKIKHLPSGLGSLRRTKGESSGKDDEMDGSADHIETLDATRGQTQSFGSVRTDRSSVSLPSIDTSSSSADSSSLPTPTTSSGSFVLQSYPDPAALDEALEAQNVSPGTPSSKSWVPHFDFGKVAKAVVSTGMSAFVGAASGDRRKKRPALNTTMSEPVLHDVLDELAVPATTGVDYHPVVEASVPPAEVLKGLSEEEQQVRRTEWADAERRRLTQCAQLCSQWPQSGYHVNKFGPNGAKHFYEPQSFSNPQHVAGLMQRQSELERSLCDRTALYFPCNSRAASRDLVRGEGESEDSAESYASASPSPIEPEQPFVADEETAAELRAAMTSSLLSAHSSQVSLLLPSASSGTGSKRIKNARSLTELDVFATSLALTPKRDSCDKDDDAMEVDTDTTSIAPSVASLRDSQEIPRLSRSAVLTRPARAQSCGSKRPMPICVQAGEEEKRRKVDEAMVVEEAVSTGVIMPPAPSAGVHAAAPDGCDYVPRMCASTPDLGSDARRDIVHSAPISGAATPAATATAASVSVPGQDAAMFGHVVKTSDTHPIIISPFFPAELLPILSRHLVVPRQWTTPLRLASDIDVPSLLFSYAPPAAAAGSSEAGMRMDDGPAVVLTPRKSAFDVDVQTEAAPAPAQQRWKPTQLGNLLLSSCPGKRLRMDGPVRGRGPVCRDLKTDLERIKGEGVGCLVCCLDDAELALLGVPWETYQGIAAEIGMDVIRLPMPDGFTPVSISLFDSQVSLIATRYTLRGINVLVHCRGGVGRAGLTACAWAIKMGFVQPHPSLALVEERALDQARERERERSASAERQRSRPAASTPSSALSVASTSACAIGMGIKGYKTLFMPHSRAQSTPNLSSTAAAGEASPSPAPASGSVTPVSRAPSACVEPDGPAAIPAELEHQIVMSMVERGIGMLRARRGLKAIESFEQVQFLVEYVRWLRAAGRR